MRGNGPVFDVTRHDQELAFVQPDVLIPELHVEPALQHQKKFVLVVVMVPDEWPLKSDELDLLGIQLADDLLLPLVGEGGELSRRLTLSMRCS
jgi:hypothetical protein